MPTLLTNTIELVLPFSMNIKFNFVVCLNLIKNLMYCT